MKHKHLTISSLSILIAILLQSAFVLSLYENFRLKFENEIGENVYLSIDEEYSIRAYDDYEKRTIEPMNEMSQERRDSILKRYPLPPRPSVFNIEELIKKGIIRTSSEISRQHGQDRRYNQRDRLKLIVLDSIFNAQSDMNYPHTFILIDNIEKTTETTNQKSLDSYTYKSKPFYIGIKARQTLFIHYDIPVDSFIKETIIVLLSSIIILCIAIVLVFAQIKILKKNRALVQQMRQNINGVVHDLKSPLTATVMTLGFAKQKIESPQVKEIFTANQVKVKHLISTIDSLLSVVRKTNALHKEEITAHELTHITKIIVSDLKEIYTYKPHTIETHFSLDADFRFCADKLHLENVLRNLLENSIKYSDDNVAIKLDIAVIENHIQFTVEDNGWGIPRKYRRKIYRHFFRSPEAEKTQRGYGVGLSQVKHIVESHGGTIELQSQEGVGSIFTFTLPSR